MLISFSVCGFGIMFFYGLLARPRSAPIARQNEHPVAANVGLRRFLAVGIGAAVAVGGLLKRFFAIGTFVYDGRQYSGPKVQKITPIKPEDEFYQVSKNLVAPLPALLAQVKPKPEVTTLLFHAADGYYETFRIEKAMEPTTLVAYEMNGEPLPQRHGYPLRMIVPGLYGEKNPKWLTRIELLNEADGRLKRRHGCGFYKEQGWGREGDIVPTHSRIDAPQVAGDHFEAPFKVGQPVGAARHGARRRPRDFAGRD